MKDKKRYVSTKLWSDTWIMDELNPLDRLLFVYLLTNDKTNIAGVYEISLKKVALETGIEKDNLLKMIDRMYPRVKYVDGFIVLKNAQKHQNFTNPQIKAGITTILSELPKNVHDALLNDDSYMTHEDSSHLDRDRDLDRDTKVISSNDSAKSDDLATLFNELRTTLKLSPQYKLSIKRKETLKRRLKEFSGEDIAKACRNLSRDPWNMGENPQRKKYADVDFLIKSYEQVEKWLLADQLVEDDRYNQEKLEATKKKLQEVEYA